MDVCNLERNTHKPSLKYFKNVPLTGEKILYLFDQISQVIVGALNVFLGCHSFVQCCLSFALGLLCLALYFHHLRKYVSIVRTSSKRIETKKKNPIKITDRLYNRSNNQPDIPDISHILISYIHFDLPRSKNSSFQLKIELS